MGQWVSLQDAFHLQGDIRQQAYCALDCTGTLEVWEAIHPRLLPEQERIYAFERALQAPALQMQLRGVRVDVEARRQAVNGLKKELRKQVRDLDLHPQVREVWDGKLKDTGACENPSRKDGKHKWPRGVDDSAPEKRCVDCNAPRYRRAPFNANSPVQCDRLFYELLKAPPQRNKKGQRSTDEDCLLRIKEKCAHLEPLVDAVLEIKGTQKQIGFLEARLTPDNRFPSSFNVGAAWTGRFSSSKSPLGGGGNMQNIAERHRHIFLADPGMEMCYVDLERAESWVVAMLAGDDGYIEAHEGDTHTFVARLLWPDDLPWTGNLEEDGPLAKGRCPPWDDVPGHDYRFQAKRVQHGSNYGLTPFGISRIAKLPLRVAESAQRNYFLAFPHIPCWQSTIKQKVERGEWLTNPLGRSVQLFGRPWDPHTYKQGLSFIPQSTVADVLNLALWRLWRHHDPHLVQLLAQVHDAILCQWPQGLRQGAIQAVSHCMSIPIPITDFRGKERTLRIPIEIATGQNWGKRSLTNPGGLKKCA